MNEELEELKRKNELALSYTFDLIASSVNLTKQQKEIIAQIRSALTD